MKRALRVLAVSAATGAAVVVGPATAASAAHCTDSGMPGSSDFAAHVRAANGPGGHAEGDHRGWASCEERSANFVTP
jgi:V8-like Glu-specific endopeptidase